MFNAFHHVAVVVPKLDEALTLFRDKMGLRVVMEWSSEEEGNEYAAVELADGGNFLELICPVNKEISRFAAHLDRHGASVHHIAFRSDAMDELIAEMEQNGISGTEPMISSSGWRINFFDEEATLGIGLQLVDGKHENGS
jgi:methylmalonyl-CoA/ethylmalonyl-CoA epimerase